MNIYTPLFSIPHNPHYLNRYIKFITHNKLKQDALEFSELHHIFPKSMFGEVDCFVELSPRAHYIAHLILMKAFPNSLEMKYAFVCMCNGWQSTGQHRQYKISSIQYDKAKCELSLVRSENWSKNNPGTSQEVKELIIQRHGGLGMASPSISAKVKEKMLSKLGVDNVFKDPSFIRDNIERCKERWADPEYNATTRKKISEARKGKPIIRCSCIICNRLIQANNLTNHYRWSH